MTASHFSATLHAIVRDSAEEVQPICAAIAALTGQPLTAVVRTLSQSSSELRGLAGVAGRVPAQDACHAALHRFGYEIDRIYVNPKPWPLMGEVLRAYALAAGPVNRLFVLCESGDAYAFLGRQAASWRSDSPVELESLISNRVLDLYAPVQFAASFSSRGNVPIESPNTAFLATLALPAFGLADTHNVELEPLDYPYWLVTFPIEMRSGVPGTDKVMVCGERELLCVLMHRVKAMERSMFAAVNMLARLQRVESPRI